MQEIKTTRLILRAPKREDKITLGNLWHDVKVREFLGGIVSDVIIESKFVALYEHWSQHQFGQFTVSEKKSNQIIGLCGLHHSEDGIEVSYMFFPEVWGQGFAFEAVQASIEWFYSSGY